MVFAGMSFAPWVPMHKKDLARVEKLAKLKPGEIFYDLGSGDGRVVFYLAKQTKAKAIGVEMAWPMWLISEIKRLFLRRGNVAFKLKDLFKEDLSQADVVYFFGLPKHINDRLKEKLATELKSGARVISYVFQIEGWEPKIVDKPGEKEVKICLYEIASH
jgi:SAM-dependent methyltransferase